MTASTFRVHAGMTLAERRAARARVLEQRLAQARRDAATAHRSIACAWYGSHGTCVGERDGGAGCLCECHDPTEPTPSEPAPDTRNGYQRRGFWAEGDEEIWADG